MSNVIGRVLGAGGKRIVLKVAKALPIIGAVAVVAFAAYEIRKKGMLKGLANVALDVTPVVGSAKNVIEIFTGDWLADKPDRAENERVERRPARRSSL
ncbi:MAG: hypothetical protein ABI882_01405 [Acidobacteriota bacterium]